MTSAYATGLATVSPDGIVLDAWFPAPELSEESSVTGTTVLEGSEVPAELAALVGEDADRGVSRIAMAADRNHHHLPCRGRVRQGA